MSNIPWQGLPDLAAVRQEELRERASTWRTWRDLRRARREARRGQTTVEANGDAKTVDAAVPPAAQATPIEAPRSRPAKPSEKDTKPMRTAAESAVGSVRPRVDA